MHMSRLFSVAFVMSVGAGAAVVACGGNSSKSGPDAKVYLDAPGSGSGSGSNPTGSGSVLGRHCTPTGSGGSAAFPQGDCPAGYECMQLSGGHDTWCSKKCVQGSGDQCNQGYTGTGEGACLFGITFGSGSNAPTGEYCGIICELTLNGSNACSNCTGACPGTALTCSATLTFSGSGTNSGSACF